MRLDFFFFLYKFLKKGCDQLSQYIPYTLTLAIPSIIHSGPHPAFTPPSPLPSDQLDRLRHMSRHPHFRGLMSVISTSVEIIEQSTVVIVVHLWTLYIQRLQSIIATVCRHRVSIEESMIIVCGNSDCYLNKCIK